MFPVVLYGAKYWRGLLDWLGETVRRGGCVDAKDLALCSVADSPEEVLAILLEHRRLHLVPSEGDRRE
jgi:hypothetical protein